MQHETETVDLGQGRVARRRFVRVAPEALYEVLSDPHRHHELDGSGTVSAAVVGPTQLQLGDRFTVRMHLGPVRYSMTSTVTEVQPGRVLEWRLPMGQRWRWELAPVGSDATRVTETFDYRGARVPALIKLLRYPSRNATGIERTLAGLERNLTR